MSFWRRKWADGERWAMGIVATIIGGVSVALLVNREPEPELRPVPESGQEQTPVAEPQPEPTLAPGERSWSAPEDPENPRSAAIISTSGARIEICYDRGDGPRVYIDASNSVEGFNSYSGELADYPSLRIGDCGVFGDGTSPNAGVYLGPAATEASGRWRLP